MNGLPLIFVLMQVQQVQIVHPVFLSQTHFLSPWVSFLCLNPAPAYSHPQMDFSNFCSSDQLLFVSQCFVVLRQQISLVAKVEAQEEEEAQKEKVL